jgi:hypothetical protein
MGDNNTPDPPIGRNAKRKLHDAETQHAPRAKETHAMSAQLQGAQATKRAKPSYIQHVETEQEDFDRTTAQMQNLQGVDKDMHCGQGQGAWLQDREREEKVRNIQSLLKEIGSILTKETEHQDLICGMDESTHEIIAELARHTIGSGQECHYGEYNEQYDFNTSYSTQQHYTRPGALESAIDRLMQVNEKLQLKIEKLETRLENSKIPAHGQQIQHQGAATQDLSTAQEKYSVVLKNTPPVKCRHTPNLLERPHIPPKQTTDITLAVSSSWQTHRSLSTASNPEKQKKTLMIV